MSQQLPFFATTPKGLEPLLSAEIQALGGRAIRPASAGVSFRGRLEVALRLVLWSRVASRVLLTLGEVEADSAESLYGGVHDLPWEDHIPGGATLAVDFLGSNPAIRHTTFGAMKVKDAVVDRLRELTGGRPDVDLKRPDLRLNVVLKGERAVVSLDLAGESLHRRGYRTEAGEAPLRETLAAAVLLHGEWPGLAAAGGSLVDPMTGSGTLPIEGALMAADVAPGLLRERHGFEAWRGHEAPLWRRLLEEAAERRAAGMARMPAIYGYDADPGVVEVARRNADRAGLGRRLRLEVRALEELAAPPGQAGLVAVNPPYGVRLGGDEAELERLYGRLGRCLRREFAGWRWALLSAVPPLGESLARVLGAPLPEPVELYNGQLRCSLWVMGTGAESRVGAGVPPPAVAPPGKRGEGPAIPPDRGPGAPRQGKGPRGGAPAVEEPVTPAAVLGPGGEMLANRLRKNLRHLGRWAEREGVGAFRLYDADLPEYVVAVDLYRAIAPVAATWVHLQEYRAPASIDPRVARERLGEALTAVARVVEVPPQRVILKVRQRGRGGERYGLMDHQENYLQVPEGGLRFLVNLTDRLDTGLFPDHRRTRGLVRELAGGRRFLNLFGYTGSATVYAAAGGAAETLTVDLSRTYLEWTRRNLILNGFGGGEHRFLQADCLAWLEEVGEAEGRFGLIFLDPPTFSNSERMADSLDLLRDHPRLIARAVTLLEPGGVLLFSSNARHFRMAHEALPRGLVVEEITRRTIPPDFARGAPSHRCWRITRPGG